MIAKLRLLVFSSVEGRSIAHAVKDGLQALGHEVKVWDEVVFLPGEILLNALIALVPSFDAAVLVMTSDDSVTHRGTVFEAPRDNLVLELGLCLGAFGPKGTFVVAPAGGDLKLPTDVGGLLYARYDATCPTSAASVASACTEIAAAIDKGSRRSMAWSIYFEAVCRIGERVLANDAYGGFRPQVVIGVNPGGAVFGGLLYMLHRRSFKFLNLWPLDTSPISPYDVRQIRRIQDRAKGTRTRILVVDDSMKTGASMRSALAKIDAALQPGTYETRTAVIVYRDEFNTTGDGFRPDYHLFDHYTDFPYSRV
jgi:hypoxanthine phosphoribosyltransferase